MHQIVLRRWSKNPSIVFDQGKKFTFFVCYVGVIIDEHLSFIEYMNTLKQKLGILAKLRYYVTADVLKAIYYAFFDSYEICISHLGTSTE